MNSVSLNAALEKEYNAAVFVRSFRVISANEIEIVIEAEIEIFGEQPSKTYISIRP